MKNNRIDRVCLNCGKEFSFLDNKHIRKPRQYCSLKCYWKYAKGKKNYHFTSKLITCDICEKKFYRVPSKVNNKNYCSKECTSKGRITSRVTYCGACGKELLLAPNRFKADNNYCSYKCRSKKPISQIQREKMTAGLRAKLTGKKRSKEVKEKLRQANLGKKLSEETKRKLRSKIYTEEERQRLSLAIRGKRGEEFDGYVTPIDKKERIRFRREMQKLVFERDDYTCQICGIRGIDLQVDHIQEWSEYVELRFKLENCRTLCAKCHYLITFGKPMPKNIKGWGHNLLKGGALQ